MPKQLLELKLFNSGTILAPDVKDIPPEAASFSMNIDSATENGVLKGIPTDSTVPVGGLSGAITFVGFLDDDYGEIMILSNGTNWLQVTTGF